VAGQNKQVGSKPTQMPLSPEQPWLRRLGYEWTHIVEHAIHKQEPKPKADSMDQTLLQKGLLKAYTETGLKPLLMKHLGYTEDKSMGFKFPMETNWAKALNPMTWLIFAVQSLRAVTVCGIQDLYNNTDNKVAKVALKTLDIILDTLFAPLVFIGKVANLAIHLPADLLINSIISPMVKEVAKLFAKERAPEEIELTPMLSTPSLSSLEESVAQEPAPDKAPAKEGVGGDSPTPPPSTTTEGVPGGKPKPGLKVKDSIESWEKKVSQQSTVPGQGPGPGQGQVSIY